MKTTFTMGKNSYAEISTTALTASRYQANRYGLATLSFIFLMLFAFMPKVKASHVVGGEVSYTFLSSTATTNTYRIRLTLYRDCAGITLGSTAVVNAVNANTNVTLTSLTLIQVGTFIDRSIVCPGQQSRCTNPSSTIPGVQEFIYEANYTVSNTLNHPIRIDYSICCRANGVTNLSNPGSQNTGLSTTIPAQNLNYNNNSPVFQNSVNGVFCLGQLASLSLNAFDPDGDALVYSLVAARQSFSTAVTYAAGFSATSPLSSSTPITINPSSGIINFTPSVLNQRSVVAVRVEEFRNGTKIGEVFRDMEVTTINCGSNAAPVIAPISNQVVQVGQSVCIPVSITDANNDSINVTALGGIIPPATFTILSSGPGFVNGQFCFTPTLANAANTYGISISAVDNFCPVPASVVSTFNITVPCANAIPLQTSSTIASCGLADGSASASMSGGVPPFAYSWTGPGGFTASSATISNVAAGTYSITVVDGNSCTGSSVVTVAGGATPIVISAIVNNAQCGTSTGSLDLSASGGVTPYTYALNGNPAQNNGQFNNLPTGTYTVTVLDANNCPATSTHVINAAADITPPAALCKNVTLYLDANGNVNIYPADVDNGSFDDCSSITLGLSAVSFNCSNLGANTVTLTVTDAANNTSTCTSTVTVIDNIVPDLHCEDVTLQLDANGQATLLISQALHHDHEACTITATWLSQSNFTCSHLGNNAVTVFASDNSNNIGTCISTVTVVDNVDPIPDVTNLPVITGECSATVTAPTATDNCAGTVTGTTNDPTSYSAQGTYTITWTYNDGNGNTSSQTQTVVVDDVTDPVIICPSNITDTIDLGQCGAIVNYTIPTATDNCAQPSQPVTNTYTYNGSLQNFTVPAGVTSITIRAKGASGGAISHPSILPGGRGADMQGEFAVTPGQVLNIIVGGEGNPSSLTSGGGGASGVGIGTTPLIVAGGGAGIDWQDTGYPGIHAVVTPNGIAGNGNLGSGGTAGSDGLDYAFIPNNISRGGRGWNTNVLGSFGLNGQSLNTTTTNGTWGIGGGGGSVGAQYCNCGAGGGGYSGGGAANSNRSGGGGGSYNTGSNQVNAGGVHYGNGVVEITYSAIPPVSVTQINGLPSGSNFPVGTTVNTFVATDLSGNTDTCSFIVNVVDTEAPFITCPSNISQNALTGLCGAIVNYTTPVGVDFCPGATTTQTAGLPSGSVFPVGTTTNTFVTTDGAGNTASCSFTVIIADAEAPSITCPANISLNNDPNQCGATVTYNTPVGTDNCPGATTTQTAGLPSGSVFPVGTTTNTFVTTDAAGNTASCSFTVTITDAEAPMIICPANISVNNDPNQCGATVIYNTPVGTDNCPGATTTQTAGLVSGSVFPVGTTTNIFVTTDAAGNAATCSFDVTVIGAAPTIVCPSNIAISNDSGICGAVVTYPIPTVNSTCPCTTPTSIPGYTALGNYNGHYYFRSTFVTDWNTANNNAIALGGHLAVVNDAAENAFLAALSNDGWIGLNDELVEGDYVWSNGEPFTYSNWSFGEPNNLGDEDYVQLYSTGGWNDLPASSQLTYIVEFDCLGMSLTGGLASGSVFPVGSTTVSYQYVDANGLSDTCSFTVTITDSEAPAAVLQSTPELLYYRFEGSGSTVLNEALTPPSGTNNATILGNLTQGSPGICSNSLIGSSSSSSTNHMNTGWNAPLSGTSWTLSFKTSDIPPSSTLFYIFGNSSTGFRCFTNGVAGPNNWILRGNSFADVLVPGGATIAPHTITFVYSLPDNHIKAYLDGTLVNTVSQSAPQINNGANNLIIGGYGTATGLASGGKLDEFRLYQHALSETEVLALSSCSPSSLTLQQDIVVGNTIGQCGANVNWTAPSFIDNCGIDTIVSSHQPGDFFSVGTTLVTYTATDLAGNNSTYSFNVTVNDTEDPMISCLPLTLNANGSGCSYSGALTPPTATDNCTAPITISGPVPAGPYSTGITTVTWTATDSSGNSSTCTQDITVLPTTSNGSMSITSCGPYTWTSTTFFVTGVYTKTFTNAIGCDSVHVMSLTVTNSTSGSSAASACGSYNWNGTLYTSSGQYTQTFINANGCDSIHTLSLTIYPATSGTSSAAACYSYTWNSTTYTTSGAYTQTFVNANGCDSLHTLQVTINGTTTGISQQQSCDSYSWNNTLYTTSGQYTHTYVNVNGCDSVHTLDLTIIPSATGSSSATACDSYTWNTNTYTQSGTYTQTFTALNGCDSIHTLQLTINNSSSNMVAISAGGCYTWVINGNTYTTSGTYTHTSLNQAGCVHTEILQLTVSPQVVLQTRVILSGPYNAQTGLMHDSLRVNNYIPQTEPYSASPFFPAIGGAGNEQVDPTILAVSGPDAIVDWLYLELRSASNPATRIATKRALLQRDGDVVSHVDGASPVTFSGTPGGMYYISVKHRNHLGVMSAAAVYLAPCAGSSFDFTLPGVVYVNPVIANVPRRVFGSVHTLWSGDASVNKNTKYNGASNDKTPILNTVGIATPNNTVYGYREQDCNMDGKVRYNNTDNDRQEVLNNVGVSTPNAILFQHTPN